MNAQTQHSPEQLSAPLEQAAESEMEYSVSIAVQGRFHVSVPIPNGMSKEEAVRFAIKRANEEATNADFGALEDIDWNVDHVEDDDENYVYPDE